MRNSITVRHYGASLRHPIPLLSHDIATIFSTETCPWGAVASTTANWLLGLDSNQSHFRLTAERSHLESYPGINCHSVTFSLLNRAETRRNLNDNLRKQIIVYHCDLSHPTQESAHTRIVSLLLSNSIVKER